MQLHAQAAGKTANGGDTAKYIYQGREFAAGDTAPSVTLREVDIISFKDPKQWFEYYRTRNHVLTVMPYVKIAKELYTELHEKEETEKRKDFRHDRRDVEKEMRTKFEKELKDLTTSEGEVLFKLISRETGSNSYTLIKEMKGPMAVWFYQMVAKHWGYDLKKTYDPGQEKMIELVIKDLGPAYKI